NPTAGSRFFARCWCDLCLWPGHNRNRRCHTHPFEVAGRPTVIRHFLKCTCASFNFSSFLHSRRSAPLSSSCTFFFNKPLCCVRGVSALYAQFTSFKPHA